MGLQGSLNLQYHLSLNSLRIFFLENIEKCLSTVSCFLHNDDYPRIWNLAIVGVPFGFLVS